MFGQPAAHLLLHVGDSNPWERNCGDGVMPRALSDLDKIWPKFRMTRLDHVRVLGLGIRAGMLWHDIEYKLEDFESFSSVHI